MVLISASLCLLACVCVFIHRSYCIRLCCSSPGLKSLCVDGVSQTMWKNKNSKFPWEGERRQQHGFLKVCVGSAKKLTESRWKDTFPGCKDNLLQEILDVATLEGKKHPVIFAKNNNPPSLNQGVCVCMCVSCCRKWLYSAAVILHVNGRGYWDCAF